MKYLEENDNFEDLIKEGIYLVDFYAQWCGPCKMLSPILEGIEDKINIIKVDIDKFPLLANKYKILSIPTLIFFINGEEAEKRVGFMPEEELLEIIDSLNEPFSQYFIISLSHLSAVFFRLLFPGHPLKVLRTSII